MQKNFRQRDYGWNGWKNKGNFNSRGRWFTTIHDSHDFTI